MEHHIWQWRGLFVAIGLLAFALVSANLAACLHWIDKPFPGFFLHENLTVAPYFLPGWTGGAAGLKSLDRVVAIDGRPLHQRADLYDLVPNSPTHSEFHYRIIRDAQTLELTVASMSLSFHDWFLSFGVYVIMGMAFLIIGAAPYYLRAASPAALPLCFMVLAVFVWFESTFDFMTAGVLPNFRTDADAQRGDPPGAVAKERQASAAVPSRGAFPYLCDFRFARRIEQRDFFWAHGKMDSCFSSGLSLY